MPLSPEDYDNWYRSPRGEWIGKTEHALLDSFLQPHRGETILDVGCGTGYFTRAFAAGPAARVVGVDSNASMLRYARDHGGERQSFLVADARRLPFPDRAFDLVISVTALCFIEDERGALAEMLRVARRRVALGLLNRRSLLFLEAGRHGGRGGYRGARWHTVASAQALFVGLPASDVVAASAVLLPSGGRIARWGEAGLARLRLPIGGFIAVAATRR